MSLQVDLVEAGLETAMEMSGVPVRYEQGDQADEITAIPGNSDWDQTQDGMVVREAKSQDWIFPLPLAQFGADFRPRPGDRISTLDGSQVLDTYEAMSPGGEQVWRFMRPSRVWIRVFSKKVG